MEELRLLVGRELGFTPNIAVPKLQHKSLIDDVQRQVGKLMGVSEEDLLRYGSSESDSADQADDAQRRINKLLGVSEEDLLRYGSSESDSTDQADDAVRQVSKLLGISEADLLKYGADLT